MSSLFPIRSDPSPGGRDPRVVDLDGEDADEVFSALSSKTARRIVTALHEEPRTQSDLAEAIDTTVQNVRYHLDKLEDAGLVEVVDTWYSSRGNEMKVYAPADGALIVSGDRGRAARLKTALSRLVGGVGVLGLASLLVQVIARRFGAPISPGFSAGGGDGAPTGKGGDDGATLNETNRKLREAPDQADGTETVAQATTESGGEATETVTTDGATPTYTTTGDASTATTTAERSATETTVATTETTTTTTTTDATATTTTADPTSTTVEGVTSGNTSTVTDGGVDLTTTATDAGTTVAADGAATAGNLPPGLMFFLGGVSVLVVLVTVWYWSGG